MWALDRRMTGHHVGEVDNAEGYWAYIFAPQQPMRSALSGTSSREVDLACKALLFRSQKRLTLYWRESHFVSLSPSPTEKVLRLPSARCFASSHRCLGFRRDAGAASASQAEPEPEPSCAALSARPATTGSRPKSVPGAPRPTGFVAGAAARRVPAAGRRPPGNPVATVSGIAWRGSDGCASLNKPCDCRRP